jgi:RNA polymerase sigma factor (sigma-70 family)
VVLEQSASNHSSRVCEADDRNAGEAAFLAYLPSIERAIRFTCRRLGVRPSDADDFASNVKVRLIEHDYAIIRQFEGRCSFEAYISIVIQRMLFDHRIRLWGKWHASAEAKRMGGAAIMLEVLLWRDERTPEDAVAITVVAHPELTRAEAHKMMERLPQRIRRRDVEVDADSEDARLSLAADTVPAGAFGSERMALGRRAARAVTETVQELVPLEQTIFRMRFEAEMTVAEIARALDLAQKPLYRAIQRQLLRLRHRLSSAGITLEDVEDLIRAGAPGLDLGFNARTPPSTPLFSTDRIEDGEEETSADGPGKRALVS